MKVSYTIMPILQKCRARAKFEAILMFSKRARESKVLLLKAFINLTNKLSLTKFTLEALHLKSCSWKTRLTKLLKSDFNSVYTSKDVQCQLSDCEAMPRV